MNSLYRSLAKKVHPDFNGGGAEFTRKMQEVNRFKNDPEMLLKLARQWGLNIDGTFDHDYFDRKSEKFKNKVYDAVVGAIVRRTFQRGRYIYDIRGVIIKIRDIKKGKLRGGKEFFVYNFLTEKIWSFKTIDPNPFTVVGMADSNDVQRGVDRLTHAKEIQKAKRKSSQELADARFSELGLKKNYNYEKNGLHVEVSISGWFAKLIRTTAKCVYVKFSYSDKIRRFNISKVSYVVK